MTYGTHLRRSRHGTLYFRYVLPQDVRGDTGPAEVSVSLGTTSKREANLAALELRLIVSHYVAAARTAIRMNEPYKPNHAALQALLAQRAIKVLKDELEEVENELSEANDRIEAKSAHVERLTKKLLEKMDAAPATTGATVGPTLSAAVGAFKAERSAQGAWTEKTAATWHSRLSLLLDWFGDVPVSDVSRVAMVTFFEALQKLPKNANKYVALKGLRMRDQIAAEGFDRIAATTVNQFMESVSALFGWMDADRATWRVSGNVANGLNLSNVEEVQRVPFTPDDLRAMFSTPEWVSRQFLHSYAYWLLPLGLFTGARINELCQIDLKDFKEAHEHPVVLLCTEGLRGKNKNARRMVPLHPELIRLGLLRHVERLRAAGQTKLFPECIEKRDGHAQDASRWFGKFKTRAGVVDPRKVFHSTRHGLVSQLLNAGCDETTVVAPLVGHAGSGQASRSYWNDRDILGLTDSVKIVSYPVVTELVPVVEDVQFRIDVHRRDRRPPTRKSKPIRERDRRRSV